GPSTGLPRRCPMNRSCLAASLALAASLLVGGGCGDPHSSSTPDAGATATCAADPRASAYSAGLTLTGKAGLLQTRLMSSLPAPPLKGENKWTVQVTDATSGAGLDGVTIDVVPFMPDHGHYSPIKVVVTPMGGGVYLLDPVYLFMAGVWEVTVNMKTGD